MGTEFATGFGASDGGETASRDAAEMALAEMAATTVDFAVVFCSPTYDCHAVIDGVRSVVGDATLVGATAEGEFTERGIHTSGFGSGDGVTIALVASDEMQFFSGLGRNVSADAEASIAEAAADLPSAVEGYPHRTGLLLSSALFGQEELTLLAYQEMPIQWAGGGANDLSLENMTVFVGDETASDAVALTVIASEQPFSLGVGNRHEPIGDPVEVTKSDGYVVQELDGRPAYDVWKETFAETAQQRYGFHIADIEHDQLELFQALEEMVFGLRTGEEQYKIRSPGLTALFEPYSEIKPTGPLAAVGIPQLKTKLKYLIGRALGAPNPPTLGQLPEGALQFGHPVPEGVMLYPMTSGEERTISRGNRSAEHALEDVAAGGIAGGLVFDCPCGEVTLRDDYSKLIEAVVDPIDAPVAGMQSGGQICLRTDDMRGAHETATSVLLFPRGDGS